MRDIKVMKEAKYIREDKGRDDRKVEKGKGNDEGRVGIRKGKG